MATETDSRSASLQAAAETGALPASDSGRAIQQRKASHKLCRLADMTHLKIKFLIVTLFLLTASACQQDTSARQPMSDAEALKRGQAATIEDAKKRAKTDPFAPQEFEPDGTGRRYSVVAYGYNYTDLYIDSFEVNGAGGGNLAVSTETSPGGGHTCCTTLRSGTPKGKEFVIKWVRDDDRWCQQTVKLNDPVPPGARYLEVHFYPDGHIELFPSKEPSPPRLKLSRFNRLKRHETGNVNNDEKYSTCKDGY